MKSIILLGAPGAGKGTIAEMIREPAGLKHVSTGDMLREAVKSGSPVGKQAREFMDKGELVPDDVIIAIVMQRLDDGSESDRYMFDGFPRTMEQAVLLDENLEKRNSALNMVFFLDVPAEVTIERLTGRRICRKCGANYHVKNIPPKVEGVCDVCGGELYQRPDDCEETIRNRLDVFRRQTESLIDYYEKKGILVRVDSSRAKEVTARDISEHLKKLW